MARPVHGEEVDVQQAAAVQHDDGLNLAKAYALGPSCIANAIAAEHPAGLPQAATSDSAPSLEIKAGEVLPGLASNVNTSLGFQQSFEEAITARMGFPKASAARSPTARSPKFFWEKDEEVEDEGEAEEDDFGFESVASPASPDQELLEDVSAICESSRARPVLACADRGRMSASESANIAFEICEGKAKKSNGKEVWRSYQRSKAKKSNGKEDTTAAWRCAIVRRLGRAPNSSWNQALDSVWSRWAKYAEGVAGEHVSASFDRLLSELVGAATTSTVEVSLAFAGVGAADHEATMRQTEQLCREQLPSRCVALVGPDELGTLVTATRNIAEQFMRTGSGQAHDVQHEDEDPDEDCEIRNAHRYSILDFIDWYHQRSEEPSCAGFRDGVVLIIERVEDVKKDVLRDLLSSWGSACIDAGCGKIIPMSVVLGLQRPLRSRFDLFEGEPAVNLRINNAVSLFDGRQVCSELLESLALDVSCALALSPQSISWLQETFEKTRSISGVLKALALLCAHLLSKAPLAALCEPLAEGSPGDPDLRMLFPVDKVLGKTLLDRLKAIGGADVVRSACPEFSDIRSGKAVLEEASLAAVEALYWRYRVVSSLNAWDALLWAVEPFCRGKAKLDRLHCLLQAVWPSESNEEVERPKEEARVDLLISTLVERLKSQMTQTELERLHAALVEASGGLDSHLQSRLSTVKKGAALAGSLQGWFKELRETCLQPLAGPARSVFCKVFDTGLASAVVEPCVSGCQESEDVCSNMLLAPLAAGPGYQLAESPPDDVALLYRIFECFSGSLMPVPDLFDEFSKLALRSADSAICDSVSSVCEELPVRFGRALMALHAMGLHTPLTTAQNQRQTGRPFDCWRLRKRCFGRVWLQERRANQEAGNAAIVEALAKSGDKADEEDVWTQHADFVPDVKAVPPAFLGRPMVNLHLARTFKGDKRGRVGWSDASKETSNQPPAKKAKRARVFMG